MEKIDKLNPSDLVFCDEMGVDNNICILHGWSEIGKRSYGDVDGFRSERRSIVAGHIPKTKDLVAPIEYKGFMDRVNHLVCVSSKIYAPINPV